MVTFLKILSLIALIAPQFCCARTVSVWLNNGDRVTGEIVGERAGRLVISNEWATELAIPLAQIQEQTEQPAKQPPISTNTNIPTLVKSPPPPTATNQTAKLWKTDAQVGLNLVYGIRDRQIYFGRVRTDYKRPYERDPKESARLSLTYSGEYGSTDNEVSANNMYGGVTSDFDLNRRYFFNNAGRVGYDQIRKIDLMYELGPGVGYHLIQKPKLTLNTIVGINYRAEYERDNTDSRAVYYRLAQDFKWQITDKLIFDELIEYFPAIENFNDSRARLEANLRYKLLHNISLNLTVQDFYDTQPAQDVSQNELKIRSTLGVNF